MDSYKAYINFLIFLKITYIFLAVLHLYYRRKGIKKDQEILYWKSRIEFIFTISMAILLIYLFNPRKGDKVTITGETKLLLFLFGFIILITAKWDYFISTSHWFKEIQHSLK
jgi:phosphatidylglycerophosphate synthase